MFDIDGPTLLAIIARVSLIYVACTVLLRVSGRREMSELGPMDLLTMLLISETVSPAMTGGDESIPGGLVAAATLIALAVFMSWIAARSTRAERLLHGDAIVLIRDGHVSPSVMRKYRITNEDLRSALHQKGLLSVGDVARAFVEADGKITIIKRSDHEESLERRHGKQ